MNNKELITTHINADFDAIASLIAVKKLHPSAIVFFPGSQEKSAKDDFVKKCSRQSWCGQTERYRF